MHRSPFTDFLLFIVAMSLVMNLLVPTTGRVRAASSKLQIQMISKSGVINVDGEVIGFSCVNKGAYTECAIASR